MKIHEYQAKELFVHYQIPIQEYTLCLTPEEASTAFDNLNSDLVVVKAQVLTGGRGKSGGVKLARTKDETFDHANNILGMHINGFEVSKVTVNKAVDIASEYYMSFIIDRNNKCITLMMSKEGGMEIEEVAATHPEKISKFHIDPFVGIPDYLARKFAFTFFQDITLVDNLSKIIQRLYRLFIDKDASLLEINPLVVTTGGELVAVDGKAVFDDNSLYRQEEIQTLFEPDEQEEIEAFAKSKGFSYVMLNGFIGCMVNGAGLAMTTMDMIKLYGGEPANFLDIGGSSNPNKVIEAMKLLLNDKNVKVVMINIFGGITRCDDVATGLMEAYKQMQIEIPVIVRLTGTNEKEGRALLADSPFIVADTMNHATELAVEYSNKTL